MYDASIVIATFRRPHLLPSTIESCVNQTNTLKLKYQIVVVDNSPDRSAQPAVERLAREHAVPIIYVSEPRQNISLARNAGIAHSDAQLIAFIDDDEQAAPEWLDRMVGALRRFDADMVFGPVSPVFEKGRPPRWDPNGSFYTLDRRVPTGSSVPHGATCNVVIRAGTCLSGRRPFDPEFGLTGGGDTDFSMRMSKLGRKLVWCAEAHVREFIPENRCEVAYILRRVLCQRQGFLRCCVRNNDHPFLIAAYWMAIGLAQIAVWTIPSLVMAPFASPLAVRAKAKVAAGIGKVFWMKSFTQQFYRDAHVK